MMLASITQAREAQGGKALVASGQRLNRWALGPPVGKKPLLKEEKGKK
jgi:hypothetical protein